MNCPPSAGRSRPRIGRGQKYLLSGLDFAQDVVAHTRIELGERVVEQKHRRRARRFRDRQQLGQPLRERQQTLVGPHRDDVLVELEGTDARVFGSRGQQRLLALALRLAELLPITEATGTSPVLLLDDALSELDPSVRDNVLREVEAAEQVFLTTPDPWPAATGGRWAIHGGGLAAA